MENNKLMELSIVIPTYNRSQRLRECLVSLNKQSCSKDRFEVIVVDNGSCDDTLAMLKEFACGDIDLKYFYQPIPGPAATRNFGIKESLGKIVAFTDDDCILNQDWIELMILAHKDNAGISAVGGLTQVPKGSSVCILASQFLSTGSIETDIGGKRDVIFFPTCNVSFKREVFDEYYFDQDFPLPGGEDLEFFWKLFKAGHKFLWDKNIRVTHYRAEGLKSFIHQAYIYGQGNLLVKHRHQDQPLLKELRTGKVSFWIATLANILKLPRFAFFMTRRLSSDEKIFFSPKKLTVYGHYLLHKVFYIMGNIREYFRILAKKLPAGSPLGVPKLLILDISHRCNLTCKMCDIWQTAANEKDIDTKYVKDILYQAKELGIKEIAFSGGEPLLRSDIFELIEYAQSIGIKNLGLLTNGVELTNYIEKLKPYLLDGTVVPVVSFDSLDANLHNDMRNCDFAWNKTKQALEELSLLKSRNSKVSFSVITIILNRNLEELIKIAGFIKSLKANSLQFQGLLPNNLHISQRKQSKFWVADDRLPILDEAIDSLIEFKSKNPKFILNSNGNLELLKKYYRGKVKSSDVECLSAKETVLISNQGNCTTCFSNYGDIKTMRLQYILSSDRRSKVRDKAVACKWPCLLPCFCDKDQGGV